MGERVHNYQQWRVFIRFQLFNMRPPLVRIPSEEPQGNNMGQIRQSNTPHTARTANQGYNMKRWPIIRHIRYFCLLVQVNRHYELWMKFGYLPINADRDYAILDKVWNGEI